MTSESTESNRPGRNRIHPNAFFDRLLRKCLSERHDRSLSGRIGQLLRARLVGLNRGRVNDRPAFRHLRQRGLEQIIHGIDIGPEGVLPFT